MGDANTVLDAASARHLLRRTGFGAAPKNLQRILDGGLTRGQAADQLIAFKGKNFTPKGKYIDNAHDRWVKFMIKAKYPLQEKLVLFWHDHFATSNVKVQNVRTMGLQIRLMHIMCKGSFKDFVKAMNRDAAMIEFLDTVRNHKDIPNENYARELQELFTLGVHDFAGNPNYKQEDIVQIARALTGWDYEYNTGISRFHDYDHDYNADFLADRGPKVIYQSTGGFGAGGRAFDVNGEGAQEIDTVIDIIFDHTDTNGKNTVARRTARRLLEYFAHPINDPISPADVAVVDQVVAESGFDANWNIGGLLRAIFVNDAFYETAAPEPFTGSTKKSVKWPIDYVVTTLRLLGVNLASKFPYVDGGDYQRIRDQLTSMGQTLLEPPSVFGWDWESSWISSATLLARYNFATDIVSARNGSKSTAFHPERFIQLTLTDPDDILAAVTDALGITDQLTAAERNALVDYLTDGGANPTLDLNDYDTRNRKLHGLFALVLQSPAYQLH
ncbi:MAG: DUF1800 family protein [Deltaproteobacteria bacterium]|nr:DUF1800 family protein [Deltaproteobacteria bacterium]